MSRAAILVAALLATLAIAAAPADSGCSSPPTSDDVQREQQERLLAEGTSQVGMPAIKNFRERKILKDILELRDQSGLVTFTYVWSDVRGEWTFFCHSIGYGLPAATQFSNPQKAEYVSGRGVYVLPQADPNGLFSPASAEGTWVLCKDPAGTDTRPVYLEPRVIVSPFELPQQLKPIEVVADKKAGR